jgi:hypothetical protein
LRALVSAPPDLPILPLPPVTWPGDIAEVPADARHVPAAPAVGDQAGLRYVLSLRAQRLRLAGTGERLLAPAVLAERLQPHPYQLRVVEQVLREKRPAAILADEVGLGKTVEAGLVLKELLLRGIVRSALIVAPRALVAQWQEELRARFGDVFVLPEERHFAGFDREDRVICSFEQLVRGYERVVAREWDCLIVDEAHLLANLDTRRRRCVAGLRTRWRLLLTATPIQNRLGDLYSLIDLVAPGRLGTPRQFSAEFTADPATGRTPRPEKLAELRAIAGEVMCRTRRADAGIVFAPRQVETYLVEPSSREGALTRAVTAYLRALYQREVEGQVAAGNRAGQAQAAAAAALASVPAPAGGRRGRTRGSRAATPDGAAGDARTGRPAALARAALIREIIALQQSLSSSPQAIGAALRARADRHPDEGAALLKLAALADDLTGSKEQLLLDALARQGLEPQGEDVTPCGPPGAALSATSAP